jgi:glucose/arabinose dehydrogenase
MNTRLLLIAALAPLALHAAPVRTVPAGYVETTLATGLSRPVALAFLPGARLLIGEQYTGQIRMFKNGAVLPTPYATISPVNTNHNETGLVGLCVDPDVANNGYVYAFVTQTTTVQRVWRFTTVGDVGTSPTIIVDNIPTNNVNHNGGGIGFGPDGKLYVAIGDNALQTSAQSLTTWRGKLLRLNPDGSVPSDNPVIPPNTSPTEIYAYGLRNPFRFTFRPSNGSLILTENGPNVDDEINKITAGANGGWPNDTGDNANAAYTDPIYTFAATIAITDVMFYTGSTMPLAGEMFVCDAKFLRILRFTLDANDAVTAGPTDFVTNPGAAPIDVEQGPDGAIYYCAMNNSVGILRKVQASGTGNFAPTASFAASPATGAPPLLVNVDASTSYDPDGSIASYSWNWGDGSPAGSGLTASHTYASAGSYTIALTVTDNQGATGTATQSVVVSSGNLPPSAHIEGAAPTSGTAPLDVAFTGHGHDDADGLTLSWDFGDGTAPQVYSNVNSDVNTAPMHTYASAGTFTCTLTVTDAGGLTATHTEVITVSDPASAGGGDGGGGGRKKRCGLLGIEALLLVLLLRRRP